MVNHITNCNSWETETRNFWKHNFNDNNKKNSNDHNNHYLNNQNAVPENNDINQSFPKKRKLSNKMHGVLSVFFFLI